MPTNLAYSLRMLGPGTVLLTLRILKSDINVNS